MTIDSSGRLLIGETSAVLDTSNALLQIGASAGANMVLYRDDSSVGADDSLGLIRFIQTQVATDRARKNFRPCGRNIRWRKWRSGRLVFYTEDVGSDSDPVERMRIDSSGFVGIGETTPQNNGGGQLTVKRSSTATTGLNGVLRLKQGNATNGNRASLVFSSLDNFNVAAVNGVIETHAGSESNNEGRLEFYTKESGSSIAERMRINNSGQLLVGTTSDNHNNKLRVNGRTRTGWFYL